MADRRELLGGLSIFSRIPDVLLSRLPLTPPSICLVLVRKLSNTVQTLFSYRHMVSWKGSTS